MLKAAGLTLAGAIVLWWLVPFVALQFIEVDGSKYFSPNIPQLCNGWDWCRGASK